MRRGKTAWPDNLQPMPLPVIGASIAPACQGKYFLGSMIDAGLDPDRWVCPTILAKVGARSALSQLTFEHHWACQWHVNYMSSISLP